MSSIWREFFEDVDHRGSAARLNMVIGVLVGSVVVLTLLFKGDLTTEIFGIFMFATGGIYGFGKWRESKENIEQMKSTQASAIDNTKTG